MAELEYPATLWIEGPWLVDRDALDKLDKIIRREFSRLVEINERQLNEELHLKTEQWRERERSEETLKKRVDEFATWLRSSYEQRRECKVTIDIGGKTLTGDSVCDAARHQELANARPQGLRVHMRGGETTCSLSIDGRSHATAQLRVDCNDADTRNELFLALREWVDGVTPPKWQQLWYKFGAAGGWLVFGFLQLAALGAIYALSPVTSNPYRQEAHALLRHGLSPSEQTKAIKLLLALVSHYHATPVNVSVPEWYSVLTFGGILVCAALSIGPGSIGTGVIIGLGRGKRQIQIWRWWFHVISYSVPAWIVTTVGALLFTRLF